MKAAVDRAIVSDDAVAFRISFSVSAGFAVLHIKAQDVQLRVDPCLARAVSGLGQWLRVVLWVDAAAAPAGLGEEVQGSLEGAEAGQAAAAQAVEADHSREG